LKSEGDEVIEVVSPALEEANVSSQYIDHGVFHSLYFNDPMLEL